MQKILAFNPIPHALLKQSERNRESNMDHDEDTTHDEEPHITQTYSRARAQRNVHKSKGN